MVLHTLKGGRNVDCKMDSGNTIIIDKIINKYTHQRIHVAHIENKMRESFKIVWSCTKQRIKCPNRED